MLAWLKRVGENVPPPDVEGRKYRESYELTAGICTPHN